MGVDAQLPRRRFGVAGYAAFVSASAYFGAIGLATGLLPIDATMSANLPFHSPVFGAIALALIVGVPTSLLAWLAGQGHPRTADAATIAGLLLVGWIVVEVAIIREFSVLQVVFAGAGAGLIALGSRRDGGSEGVRRLRHDASKGSHD